MELHALADVERVGLAVLGDLPAVRQVGDDGLARIARIATYQVVVHAALAAQAVDGARLVEIERRGRNVEAFFHPPARLRFWLGGRKLYFQTLYFIRRARRTLRPGIP